MALIEFKNKPDTTTPINDKNLNHNFNELNNKIMQHTEDTNIDDIKETGNYEIFNAKGTLPTGFSTSDNNIFIQQFMRGTNYGRQILYDVRTSRWCSRELLNNVWNNWVEETNNIKSEQEVIVGSYNDKPLYWLRKKLGILPNNAVKTFSLGVSNIHSIISYELYAVNNSSGVILTIPYVYPSIEYMNYWIIAEGINIETRKIDIITRTDRRNFELYINIKYTKTND